MSTTTMQWVKASEKSVITEKTQIRHKEFHYALHVIDIDDSGVMYCKQNDPLKLYAEWDQIEILEEKEVTVTTDSAKLSDEINILDALYESCKDKIQFGNVSALNPLQEIRDMCAMALQKRHEKLLVTTDAEIKQSTFIDVLLENYEAAKKMTEQDAKRPAKDLLLETYEDLIAIFEAKYWLPVDNKDPNLAKSILRKHWHISFDDPMNQDAIKETISAMKEYAASQPIPVDGNWETEALTIFPDCDPEVSRHNAIGFSILTDQKLANKHRREGFINARQMSYKVVDTEGIWYCTKGSDCECSNKDKDAFISTDTHASCQYHKRKVSSPQTDDKLKELIEWMKEFNAAPLSALSLTLSDVISKATELLNQP